KFSFNKNLKISLKNYLIKFNKLQLKRFRISISKKF
uniref:Uncharacterized protein n=1 Tax=Ciona intestinalis TaxID=7719 RepID=H2XU47_CIOIN